MSKITTALANANGEVVVVSKAWYEEGFLHTVHANTGEVISDIKSAKQLDDLRDTWGAKLCVKIDGEAGEKYVQICQSIGQEPHESYEQAMEMEPFGEGCYEDSEEFFENEKMPPEETV